MSAILRRCICMPYLVAHQKKNSYNRAYLQPFQISSAYHQIFVAPVLECDTSVTAAAIHCFLTHILFDWAFLHITVITTAFYIICAMSGLIIDPAASCKYCMMPA